MKNQISCEFEDFRHLNGAQNVRSLCSPQSDSEFGLFSVQNGARPLPRSATLSPVPSLPRSATLSPARSLALSLAAAAVERREVSVLSSAGSWWHPAHCSPFVSTHSCTAAERGTVVWRTHARTHTGAQTRRCLISACERGGFAAAAAAPLSCDGYSFPHWLRHGFAMTGCVRACVYRRVCVRATAMPPYPHPLNVSRFPFPTFGL